jgi:hypothetical protein
LPRFQYLALQNWRRAETGGLALRRRAGVSACTCREFDNTEAMAAVMRISSMCGVGQGWKARSVPKFGCRAPAACTPKVCW